MIKSDQKHTKSISFHKFGNSFINKEVEMSDESFSKPSSNMQLIQKITEKKQAFNEMIPKPFQNINSLENSQICMKCGVEFKF